MKLGTLRGHSRDGELIVVRRDQLVYEPARDVAATLQAALDDWDNVAPRLESIAEALEKGTRAGYPLDVAALHAPLPRAYEWVDGSAFINHIILVRKARGAEVPPTLESEPLVYQGGSGVLLAATDDIVLGNPDWGLDFEGEVCVVLGDTPQGTTAANALDHVRLLTLANDISLRNLIPGELAKGFGFFNSKPATAFGPLAVTPDELGTSWREGRVHLPLQCYLNDEKVGDPDAGPEMHFSFADLIAHICKTRSFTAGTILGSGTVSNHDERRGVSCLAELRMREVLAHGSATTAFLRVGDRVDLEMRDSEGSSIFGRISQKVVAPPGRGA